MKFSFKLEREAPAPLTLSLPTYAEIAREREARDEAARREEERRERADAQRRFEAARLNRLTADWTTVTTSTSYELRRDLRVLRARSRNLARNNDYVKRFLSLVRSNVAGPAGIKLQARARNSAGELDRVLNRAVETAFASWGHPENCSASGRFGWAEAQRRFVSTMARDGEVLVRMVVADNPFGFALKFISVDWLDETFCQTNPQTGNRIIMSVEVDDDDRPVAYWLTPPPSDYLFTDRRVRTRTRVPAEEMIHKFLIDDGNSDDDCQTRGVPWGHTAMRRLKILDGYEEAEVTAARIGACKMGFFKQEGTDEYTGDEDGAGGQQKVPLMTNAQPGQFGLLNPGEDFVAFNPDHPNANYNAFVKAVLRGVAAGLDVSYFALANDLESVNFSTGRIGREMDQDVWRALQNFTAEHLCRPVFLNWLRSSMITGALRIGAAEYLRLTEPQWQPRGWKGIQPLDEARAHQIAIDGGWETVTGVITEGGGDVEEVFDTRAHELKLAEEKGVTLGKPAADPAKQLPPANDEDADEDEEDA